jgi:hypothetical protein
MENETTVCLYDVTCHTENCGNAEIGIEVRAPEENFNVMCGVCANQITDVVLKSTEVILNSTEIS